MRVRMRTGRERRARAANAATAAVAAVVALGAALALAGCTAGTTSASGSRGADAPSPASSLDPAPDDNDESQDIWEGLRAAVLAEHPDAEFSVMGSAAQKSGFHLSPPKADGTTGLAVAVACRGGGAWRVDVEQDHPRRIEGTCAGAAPTAPAAEAPGSVPLDPHDTGVLIDVVPPKGVRFWIVAFYTSD